MPDLKDLAPQFPWEGPPLPSGSGLRWPITLDDVDKAVLRYLERIPRAEYYYTAAAYKGLMGVRTPKDIPLAAHNLRVGMERKALNYRYRLLRALETGRW